MPEKSEIFPNPEPLFEKVTTATVWGNGQEGVGVRALRAAVDHEPLTAADHAAQPEASES